MAVDTKLVMQLREMTGAGIVDAKKALDESQGDLAKAAELLRAKGIAKAGSKGDRVTAEGIIHCYVHSNGKVAAMVEVLCETDFVARTPQFQEMAHDLAMHVAAASPLYVRPDEVPADVIAKEKEIYSAEVAGSGKPADIVEKIVAGKLEKYYSDVCLLNQTFVKDEDLTVDEYVKSIIAKVGENIQVRRFTRMSLGN